MAHSRFSTLSERTSLEWKMLTHKKNDLNNSAYFVILFEEALMNQLLLHYIGPHPIRFNLVTIHYANLR